MQGYTKHFTDGSTEVISDELVKASRASWSRGKLSDMSAADLHMGSIMLTISGPGDYWVADDMINIAKVPTAKRPSITVPSQFVARRVQRLIIPSDVGRFVVLQVRDNKTFHMYLSAKEGPDVQYQLKEDHVGKWLTLEYDLKADEVVYKLQDARG